MVLTVAHVPKGDSGRGRACGEDVAYQPPLLGTQRQGVRDAASQREGGRGHHSIHLMDGRFWQTLVDVGDPDTPPG